MSLKETYLSRLEADLETLKLERRLAEMDRPDPAGAGDAAAGASPAERLRARERNLRAHLQRARSEPDGAFETTKQDLERAWRELQDAVAECGAGDR